MSGTGPAASQQETRRGRTTTKSQSAANQGNKDGGSSTEQSSLAQAVTDNLSAFLDEKFARLESTLDSITTCLEDNTKPAPEKTVQSLSERAEDAENRSRRDNIRIIGLKEGVEGRRPVEFFQTWLPKMMGIETKHGAVKIDRAHRILGPLKPNHTRPVLIKLHNFSDKAKILAAAKKDQLTYEGSDIFITQDLSVKVREARRAYNDVCGQLIQRGVRFVMRYPANRCFNFNESDYSFQCAQDAQAYLRRSTVSYWTERWTTPSALGLCLTTLPS
uniref:L1 transposable element RRM domain-containing protein n=1 Tax=Sinocyclocheilus anshuiensis TaxID=1608454 RepID=A0A671S809_9TELE